MAESAAAAAALVLCRVAQLLEILSVERSNRSAVLLAEIGFRDELPRLVPARQIAGQATSFPDPRPAPVDLLQSEILVHEQPVLVEEIIRLGPQEVVVAVQIAPRAEPFALVVCERGGDYPIEKGVDAERLVERGRNELVRVLPDEE